MSAAAATAATPLVELDHVTRRYGSVTALDDVSLRIGAGEMVGLLGPNGAGKSTLLALVSGLRRPDAGTVRLFGADPRDPAARTALGTTPQETGLPETLRVGEVVDLVAGHYTAPMPREEVLERFGLTDLARRQTGGLSGGQRRRLAVALSLVGRPRLVLLDEPTTGLDVEARHILWQALRDYQADGATVVVTSHYLEEIEALARRVVVIGAGRVLVDDDLPTVLSMAAARRVLLEVPAEDEPRLAALPGVLDTRREGRRSVLLAADADSVVRALVHADVPFRDLEVRGASLEEAFLALTAATPEDPR
jgi:ABC-2 type transport system ATP-binding protein